MPNLTPWESLEINGLHPTFAAKLLAGWDDCERKGLRLALRKFGGLRTPDMQRQLVTWRDTADARDGIIGGGRDYYRVAPAGSSKHEYGSAVDLMPVELARRTDAGYKLMADTMKARGLIAGYYFTSPRDEFHIEDNAPLSTCRARWQEFVKERARFWGSLAGVFLIVFAAIFLFSPSGRG